MSYALTRGEERWLRRLRAGLSQAQLARVLGASRSARGRAEADPAPGTAGLRLDPAERLRLARRRSGCGLRETARRVGVSHVTLLRWERDADPRLRDFWESNFFGLLPPE